MSLPPKFFETLIDFVEINMISILGIDSRDTKPPAPRSRTTGKADPAFATKGLQPDQPFHPELFGLK